MFYVYVLESLKTGEFYKGMTSDMDKRLVEHFSGRCKSTKSGLPVRVVHVEICNTRAEARKMEKYFKTGYGREIIRELSVLLL